MSDLKQQLPVQEIDRQLTVAFAHLMIGKEYPSVGQLVDTALPVIKALITQEKKALIERLLEQKLALSIHSIDGKTEETIKYVSEQQIEAALVELE